MEKNDSQNIKRNVAIKVNISELLNGEYVKEEGWTPNYVLTQRGNVSRVNIIGVVVSKEESAYNTLMVDDSTGSISVRSFDDKGLLKVPRIGQIVILIGRIREYNGEKYILAEIVRPIDDKKWVLVRQKELQFETPAVSEKKIISPIVAEEEMITIPEPKKENIIPKKDEMVLQPQLNPYELVLGLIKSLDQGFGVSYEEIILNSKLKNAEEIITSLVEEGEIFEIRPGILKVL